MDKTFFKENKGITLIELLVVLVISSVMIAAFYRTFINLQSTYSTQDQIVDMQQNLRIAIDRMTREIRMVGYGGNLIDTFGNVNSFTGIITAVNSTTDTITVITAKKVANLSLNAAAGANQLQLTVSDAFDTNKKKYLCLNGQNNYLAQGVNGNLITLSSALLEDHLVNESVFLVKAITYKIPSGSTDLVIDENIDSSGGQVIAENITDFQCKYTLTSGSIVDSPSIPSDVRMVHLTVTGRTKIADSKYPGDGYRRQIVNSTVELRNMGL